MPRCVSADPVVSYNLAVEFYKLQRWQNAADACREFLDHYADDERAPAVRLYWAQSLVHLQDFSAARSQFEQYLASPGDLPDRGLAFYRIGECSYFIGDYDRARQTLAAFLKEHPDHDLAEWALVYLGESQLKLGEAAPAIQAFEEMVQRFPEGKLIAEAEFSLAQAYEQIGRKEEALAVYERIAGRPDGARAAEAQLTLGSKYFDQKQYRQAADAFARVASLNPSARLAAQAELNAGYACYYLDEFSQAIPHFDAAANEKEFQTTAWYWKGLSQKSLGDYDSAVMTFSASLDVDQNQPLAEKVSFQWGDARLRQGRYDDALQQFLRVTERWPNGDLADDALHSASEAALQAGNWRRALELHDQFKAAYPRSGLGQLQELVRGRALIQEGDELQSRGEEGRAKFEEAVRVIEPVLNASRLPQTQRQARFQLARAYERMQQDDAVAQQLGELLKIEGEAPLRDRLDVFLLRGNALARQARHAEAADNFQEMLKSSESSADSIAAMTGLLTSLIALKDWSRIEESLASLSAADQGDSQFSRLAMAAGDAAFAEKDWEAAAGIYRRLLESRPEGAFARPAQSGLAHALYEQQDHASAAIEFDKLKQMTTEDRPLQSHAAYMAALSYRQAGDLQAALGGFEAAVRDYSQVPVNTDGEGLELPVEPDLETGMNAYRSAKAGARTARELDQRDVSDRLYRAAFEELKTQPAEAQEELDKLVNEWADLAYNAEDYLRADELFQLLIQERPDSPLTGNARLVLAESKRFSGKTEAARTAFEELAYDAAQEDLIRQRAFVHLLDLAAEASDWPTLLKDADLFLQSFPNGVQTPYAEYRKGEALLETEDFAAATETLRSLRTKLVAGAAANEEWRDDAWIRLMDAEYGLKDYSALEQTVAEFKQHGPDSPALPRAELLLGKGFERQARFDDARTAYQRIANAEITRGSVTAAEAQFHLAETYLKQKNYATALVEYYKVYVGYDAPQFEAPALSQAASCDISLKNYSGAAVSLRKILDEFPESEFADAARTRLKELKDSIPELKPARP